MTRLQFLLTSILSALGSLIPWRRKRDYRSKIIATYDDMPPYQFGYTAITYTLMTKDGKWQWRTDDGREMSPLFNTIEEAVASKSSALSFQFVDASPRTSGISPSVPARS